VRASQAVSEINKLRVINRDRGNESLPRRKFSSVAREIKGGRTCAAACCQMRCQLIVDSALPEAEEPMKLSLGCRKISQQETTVPSSVPKQPNEVTSGEIS